jgi:hypothetical protein
MPKAQQKKEPNPDLEDYILKVRQWEEQNHGNEKLLVEILELQKKLGIVPPRR